MLEEWNHAEVETVFILFILLVDLLNKYVFIAKVVCALHKVDFTDHDIKAEVL